MSWGKVKLGDIADFSNGINFSKDAYAKGVKLIGVSNFGNRFYPEYEALEEIKEEVVRKSDLLTSGDIIFVRSNGNKELVGRCMLINCSPEKVTYSGFCIRARLKDTTKHDPVFWTYHFKNMAFRRAMAGTAVGANIQNLSQSRLANYEATIPDIDIQRKIAQILSAYDNLIENNQKQIKLLEEATQRLYKEWFVDLRFPGYEDVAITDGVPEGWSIRKIDEIFLIKYGKTLPTSKITETGKYPVYGANGTIGYYHQKNCDNYVVLITSRGNGSGDVSRTLDKESFVTNNSFIVNPFNESFGIPYTYQLMKATDFKSICSGSAQPQLTNNSISMLNILVPQTSIICSFCVRTQPLYDKIEQLLKQNRLLGQARDRLLPKLMNEELEV